MKSYRTYTYDAVNRLATAAGPLGAVVYNYDTLGNIIQKLEGSRTVDIQYNRLNQVSKARDYGNGNTWRSYTHDARGNVINDGRNGFTYDLANQQITQNGTVNGIYAYDDHLRRVKKVVNGETIYSIYDKAGVPFR